MIYFGFDEHYMESISIDASTLNYFCLYLSEIDRSFSEKGSKSSFFSYLQCVVPFGNNQLKNVPIGIAIFLE